MDRDAVERRAAEILEDTRRAVDAALDAWLPPAEEVPEPVHAAMRYAVLSPGKRFRPALHLTAAEALGLEREEGLPSACALELIHAFSLIHDDLPAMDDDALRRGRPTTHVKFGEAVAILAGDALSALAFGLLAERTRKKERVAALVASLAGAVGTQGMIGGQVLDLFGEGRPPDPELVDRIHRRKTAALIRAACEMAALLAGAPRPVHEALSRYGELLGLAFQVADDLLDEVASTEEMGKETRRDQTRGKQTYPACRGIGESRRAVSSLVDEAVAALGRTVPESEPLEVLARFVACRVGD